MCDLHILPFCSIPQKGLRNLAFYFLVCFGIDFLYVPDGVCIGICVGIGIGTSVGIGRTSQHLARFVII
jgi:hypothetical protein